MRTFAAPAALVSLGIIGCGDSTGPSRPASDPAPQLIVSNSMPDPAGGGAPAVAYVSIRPGGVPAGQAATITNRGTGVHRTVPLVAGGLDPIAIPAARGDSIVAEIDAGGQTLRLAKSVPVTATLTVVRNEPARGRTNVPLDARVVIIFSKPLAPGALLAARPILRQAGSPVEGTVVTSSDGLTASFTSTVPLRPYTRYTTVLGAAVLARDGAPLANGLSTWFQTGPRPTRPPVDSFPAVAPPTLSYIRTAPHTNGARSRFVLREDSTFGMQYLQERQLFEYRGRYSRAHHAIAFSFDDDGTWQAEGDLQGDSLVVRFNVTMALSDFEDGVYRLVSSAPPQPGTGALAFSHDGDIWVINADGSGLRQITSAPGQDTEPAWSPDGTRIAFTRVRHDLGHPRWGEATIQVIRTDGTGLVRLSEFGDSIYDAHPTWSPDGRRIAFHSRRAHDADPFHQDASDIWVMGSDGSNPTRLSFHQSLVFNPAWSPDGSRIAYWAWDEEVRAYGINVMGADGSGARPILHGEYAWSPAWSPDGSRLVTRYVRCTPVTGPGGEELCAWDGPHLAAVDPDGGNPARLSDYLLHGYDSYATAASWSADGLVAFTQIGCGWPSSDTHCALPTHIEVLRLSDGKVTRLAEGSAPSWRR